VAAADGASSGSPNPAGTQTPRTPESRATARVRLEIVMTRSRSRSALLPLTLILSACGPGPAPLPSTPPTSWPSSVTLTQDQGSVTLPSAYKVISAPAWLSVSPPQSSTGGSVSFSADTLSALDDRAQQPTLEAQVMFDGGHTLHVTRPLIAVSGRVALSSAALSLPPASGHFAAAATTPADPSVPGEIIVTYQGDQPFSAHTPALSAQQLGPQVLQVLASSSAARSALMHAAQPDLALRALRALPGVREAHLNRVMRAQGLPSAWTPGDEFSAAQWPLAFLNYAAVQADHTERYPNHVTVAVIDSGVQAQHPDLISRVYGPAGGALNLLSADPNTDTSDRAGGDYFSHGTAVSGVIAARHDGPGKGSGLVGGVIDAPVTVLPIKVLDVLGNGDEYRIGLAIRYAAGESIQVAGKTYTNPNPAKIINLSLGGTASSGSLPPVCADVDAATARGSLIVAAAGNDGTTGKLYPASCPNAVSVAALTLDRQKNFIHASYSQSNDRVDISAPGGSDSPITYNNGITLNTATSTEKVPDSVLADSWNDASNTPAAAYFSGTSAATPFVSALAALIVSKGLASAPSDIRARLLGTATDLGTPGRDNQTGAGVINPALALNAALNPPISTDRTPLVTLMAGSRTFTPALNADLSFQAYLPAGTVRVNAGLDTNHNGRLEDSETGVKLNTVVQSTPLSLGTLLIP